MGKQSCWMLAGFLLGIAAALYSGHVLALRAQQTERPGNSRDDPVATPRDLSGLSLKNPRVRVVHTTDPSREGTNWPFRWSRGRGTMDKH